MKHSWILIIVAAVLFLTTDDRHVGLIADGRQMIWTAIAITETGTIGQARARDLTFPRDDGDSVSRYGMGMSLAQVPAAWLAPRVEASFGAASSQPLFLIVPFLCVMVAGWLAGLAARELGAAGWGSPFAILLATLASPLAAYASLELSEALQAAALVATYTAALMAARRDHRHAGSEDPASWSGRLAVAAGAAAGIAVLTKSSMLFVAPLALLPLIARTGNTPGLKPGPTYRMGVSYVGPAFRPGVPGSRPGMRFERRGRLLGAAAAGFAPMGALWLTFELIRFGQPLASYAGEQFSHPFLDGVWRLLVGLNKGLLLYFPAAIVAVVALVRATRQRQRVLDCLGGVLPLIALLVLAAPWWAWHGVEGWGPRLLVPAIPLLAALAATEMARWRRPWAVLLVIVSITMNVPPLLQHPTPVVRYLWSCAWPAVDAAYAEGLPRFARRADGGRVLVPPEQILADVPDASPFVLLPWFYSVTHETSSAAGAARLQSPPWMSARPDIRPISILSADDARAITRRPRWNMWGLGFWPEPEDVMYASVYDRGLADQIIRAQQQRHLDLATRLAGLLTALAPDGFADALVMENYRLAKQKDQAVAYLTGLPRERRSHPAINVVLALWERDSGNQQTARQFLQSIVDSFPDSPVQDALTAPLERWPSDFGAMTADRSLEMAK